MSVHLKNNSKKWSKLIKVSHWVRWKKAGYFLQKALWFLPPSHHSGLIAPCHRGHHKETRKCTGVMQKAKNSHVLDAPTTDELHHLTPLPTRRHTRLRENSACRLEVNTPQTAQFHEAASAPGLTGCNATGLPPQRASFPHSLFQQPLRLPATTPHCKLSHLWPHNTPLTLRRRCNIKSVTPPVMADSS